MSTDDFHARMDRQDAVLHEIKTALVGNESLGHKGIVQRLQTVEDQISDHNKKLFIATGGITAVSIFAQGIWKKLLGGD